MKASVLRYFPRLFLCCVAVYILWLVHLCLGFHGCALTNQVSCSASVLMVNVLVLWARQRLCSPAVELHLQYILHLYLNQWPLVEMRYRENKRDKTEIQMILYMDSGYFGATQKTISPHCSVISLEWTEHMKCLSTKKNTFIVSVKLSNRALENPVTWFDSSG